MKACFLSLLLLLIFAACSDPNKVSSTSPNHWESRKVRWKISDDYTSGSSYLSVYSQIYKHSETQKQDLTATVSMKNLNLSDTIYILGADYYNSKGKLVRSYIKSPIYLGPLETAEIVVDQIDKAGGTGANMIFEWKIPPGSITPQFEGIMISSNKGISFTTQGKQIK